MSRRQGLTWAATSVPEIRRQWCNALDQSVDRFSQALAPPVPGTAGAGNRRRERSQAKLATEIEIMKAENNALRSAEMFWVARDMVDVSMDAASTLPAWTPALVTPSSPSGLLCWAKPAGTVPYGPKPAATTDVPWDAVWWWTRPDGMLQLVPSSRFAKQPELIAPYEVTTPLWPAHTIVINPREPRTEEANGSEAAHPFVTETRSIADTPTPRPPTTGATPDIAPTPTVTLIELRRPVRLPHDTPGGPSDRQSADAGGSAGTGASRHADPTAVNADRNGSPPVR